MFVYHYFSIWTWDYTWMKISPRDIPTTHKGTVRLERYEFFPKLAKTVPYGLKQQGKIEFCAIEVGFELKLLKKACMIFKLGGMNGYDRWCSIACFKKRYYRNFPTPVMSDFIRSGKLSNLGPQVRSRQERILFAAPKTDKNFCLGVFLCEDHESAVIFS